MPDDIHNNQDQRDGLRLRAVLGPLGFDVSMIDRIPTRESWGDLHQGRKDARRALKALVEKAGEENRDLTDAEASAYDTLATVVKNLDKEIERRAENGNRSPIYPGARFESPDLGGRDQRASDFALRPDQRVSDYVRPYGVASEDAVQLGALVRAQVLGDWSGIEHIKAAQSVGDGPTGGFMAPESLSARIIDLARNEARVIQAGAMTIPIGSAAENFATVEKDPEAHWRAEHAEIPESEMLLGGRRFDPNTLAVLVRSSIELMEDAPNFGSVLENAISAELALKLDRMCLIGTGVGQPLGLFNTEAEGGVNRIDMGANGAALADYAPLSQAVEQVRDKNAEPGAFLLSARTSGEIDRLVDTQGNPLRPPRSITERDLLVTNQIPNDMSHGTASDASAIFTGQWDEFFIALRTAVVIEATRVGGDSFKQMQVLVRGYLRADAFAVRPNHFSVVEGIIPPA